MFGSTYNGQYEDVKAFNDKVGESVHLHARLLSHCFMNRSSCVFACSACDPELRSFLHQETVLVVSPM